MLGQNGPLKPACQMTSVMSWSFDLQRRAKSCRLQSEVAVADGRGSRSEADSLFSLFPLDPGGLAEKTMEPDQEARFARSKHQPPIPMQKKLFFLFRLPRRSWVFVPLLKYPPFSKP